MDIVLLENNLIKRVVFFCALFFMTFLSCNDSSSQEKINDEENTELGDNKNHSRKNDLEKQSLNGQVASVTQILYFYDEYSSEKYGELISRDYNEYSKSGFLESSIYYELNDKLKRKTINELCPNGLVQMSKIYDQDESLVNIEFYEYDESDFLEKVRVITPEGEDEKIMYYHTNSDGLILESRSYFPQDQKDHFMISYKYDSEGRCVETKFEDFRVEYTLTSQYKFNEEGLTIMSKMFFDGEINHEYIYDYTEFDTKGNWTKQITLENKRVTYITVREIEYY